MPDFQIIEHTADVGIVAHGKDLKEAFVNAARGLTDIMVEANDIRPRETREIQLSASDREVLLVDWLNEIIYLFDTEYLIFGEFEIYHLTDTELEARCYGERIDPERHKVKTGVKAATYHMLKIDESDNIKARVLLDI